VSIEHTDIGAYSLGLLDQRDREDFEAHLAQCEECLAELGEFSAMADLFVGIGPVRVDDEKPDETTVVDFVTRRAAAQRRQARQRTWLAVAASIVLLAGGVAAGLGLAPHQTPAVAVPQVPGKHFSRTDPASGVTAIVGLVHMKSGTQATLELSNLKESKPTKCQLVAVSKTGKRRVMGGWVVVPPGVGVPGRPPLRLVGSTWFTIGELSEIQIQTIYGETLVTIPI
jgi:hypothetical protein